MVGLDTGFFYLIFKGDERILDRWSKFVRDDIFPVVSILTIGEMLYLSYRFEDQKRFKDIISNIEIFSNIVDVNRDIIERAAKLKHGIGMPYVDSIILSTFLNEGCVEVHTTDKNHFRNFKKKGINVIVW